MSRLAHRVMSEINRVTAVTPGSLVALVLLCHGRRCLPHLELVAHCRRLTRLVQHLGARTAPSLTRSGGDLREAAVREAAQLYVRGGLVRQHVPGDTLTGAARQRARIYSGDDVIYMVADDKRLMLDLSKNIIVHLFVDRALVSVALLSPPGPPASRAQVRERVRSLSRLFKLEFMFRADARRSERIFDRDRRRHGGGSASCASCGRGRRRRLRPRPRRARRPRLGRLLRRRRAELPGGLPRRRPRRARPRPRPPPRERAGRARAPHRRADVPRRRDRAQRGRQPAHPGVRLRRLRGAGVPEAPPEEQARALAGVVRLERTRRRRSRRGWRPTCRGGRARGAGRRGPRGAGGAPGKRDARHCAAVGS